MKNIVFVVHVLLNVRIFFNTEPTTICVHTYIEFLKIKLFEKHKYQKYIFYTDIYSIQREKKK